MFIDFKKLLDDSQFVMFRNLSLGKMRKHASRNICSARMFLQCSKFCHTRSIVSRKKVCFYSVAETYFAYRNNNSRMANWELLWKRARAINVSGSIFPHFLKAFTNDTYVSLFKNFFLCNQVVLSNILLSNGYGSSGLGSSPAPGSGSPCVVFLDPKSSLP